jgi:hypothetical protein
VFTKSSNLGIFTKITRGLTLFIVLSMVAGCGSLGQPAATNTPEPTATNPPPTATYTLVPTNTPLPTDTPTYTPVPTDTPTPLPTSTATPDLQATRAFEATRAAEQILVDIQAQLAEFGFPTDIGHLGWIQEESEEITLSTYNEYRYTPFAEDLVASDFILRTDITMLFRSQ